MNESRPKRTSTRQHYAQVLDQCRDMVVVFSGAQLSELFAQTSTTLLDFARRAQNNSIQSRFVEAMRLIQTQRGDIERIFLAQIIEGFENFSS